MGNEKVVATTKAGADARRSVTGKGEQARKEMYMKKGGNGGWGVGEWEEADLRRLYGCDALEGCVRLKILGEREGA
jgi:hypothetical protein